MATSDAPVSIGSITLIVRNLERVATFYRATLGLNEISRESSVCKLGQGDNLLLTLIEDKNARPYPQAAGLFHTAFLLPDRTALGSWLAHANATQTKLDGAADHLVSEAIYLTDPEGNGVEVYADRDRSEWSIENGDIKIDTIRLNLTKLAKASNGPWSGLPDDSVIGHVHLQVGNIGDSDAFYRDKLGLARMAGMEHASFYSSGGYHHHLAGNIWNSRGSGTRPVDATGFYELELTAPDHSYDFEEIVDPWGMKIRVSG